MEKAKRKYASIFELDGIPQMSKALPLALQHVCSDDRRLCNTGDHRSRSSRT